jgi:hypothetical protein
VLAALAACGSHSSSPSGASGASAGAERAAAKARADGAAAKAAAEATRTQAGADFVAAVAAGKAGDLDLKFQIRSRPDVGQPVAIDVALTPRADYEKLQVMFRGGEGLEIRGGEVMEAADKPAVGIPLRHSVTVVPRADGIFALTAVVLADSSSGSVSRTFSIPVIAGQGLPEASSRPGGQNP